MNCCSSKNQNKEPDERKDDSGKTMYYLMIAVVLIALVLVAFISFSNTDSVDESAIVLEKTDANFDQYQKTAQLSKDECGDLNDIKNIQHLSHHPDIYQNCLKKVNPEKFKEATGKDLSGYLN